MKVSRKRRRAIAGAAFTFACAVSLCAYAAVLWQSREEWSTELRPSLAVQQFGSQASPAGNALLEPRGGSVALSLNATARWNISAKALGAAQHRSIIIVSGEISYANRKGSASIDLGGNGTAIVPDRAYGDVLLPPGPARGFRIEIPPGSPCLRSSCPIELRVHEAYWRIYRVAIAADDAISMSGEFR